MCKAKSGRDDVKQDVTKQASRRAVIQEAMADCGEAAESIEQAAVRLGTIAGASEATERVLNALAAVSDAGAALARERERGAASIL